MAEIPSGKRKYEIKRGFLHEMCFVAICFGFKIPFWIECTAFMQFTYISVPPKMGV